jgi:hypothetical protein
MRALRSFEIVLIGIIETLVGIVETLVAVFETLMGVIEPIGGMSKPIGARVNPLVGTRNIRRISKRSSLSVSSTIC